MALYQGYAAYIRPAKMVPSSVPWSRKTSRATPCVGRRNRHNSILGITWVLGGLRQTRLETNDVNGNMCFIRKTYEKTYEVLPRDLFILTPNETSLHLRSKITSPSHDHSPAFAGFTCGRLQLSMLVNGCETRKMDRTTIWEPAVTAVEVNAIYISITIFSNHSCHNMIQHAHPNKATLEATLVIVLRYIDSHDLSKHGDPNGRNKNNKSIKNTTSNNYQ